MIYTQKFKNRSKILMILRHIEIKFWDETNKKVVKEKKRGTIAKTIKESPNQ